MLKRVIGKEQAQKTESLYSPLVAMFLTELA